MTTPPEIAEIEGLQRLESPEQPCVYFLVKRDVVVYVGKSVRLAERLKEHRLKDYDSVYFVRCELHEMGKLEHHWIVKLQPVLNTAHVSKAEVAKRGVERMKLMFQARSELQLERGIGKNGPSPEDIIQRMDEILERQGGVTTPASLPVKV